MDTLGIEAPTAVHVKKNSTTDQLATIPGSPYPPEYRQVQVPSCVPPSPQRYGGCRLPVKLELTRETRNTF